MQHALLGCQLCLKEDSDDLLARGKVLKCLASKTSRRDNIPTGERLIMVILPGSFPGKKVKAKASKLPLYARAGKCGLCSSSISWLPCWSALSDGQPYILPFEILTVLLTRHWFSPPP